jgi:YYY domain-containing protein
VCGVGTAADDVDADEGVADGQDGRRESDGAEVDGAAGAAGADDGGGTSWRLAGLLAAFFVGLASNLYTPARAALLALPADAAGAVAGWFGVERTGLAASLEAFGYWDASRVVPGTVNEFPLFAWLNGDLHAHMASTPFLVLVAACCLAYYRTPKTDVRRRRALVFGAVPPVAGLLALVNTWSFPTVGGLALLALALAPARPATLLPGPVAKRLPGGRRAGDDRAAAGAVRGEAGNPSAPAARSRANSASGWLRREATRLGVGLVLAAAVLAVGVGWSLPFWLGAASGRAIELLPDRSALGPLVLVHGAFLALFVPYLFAHVRAALGDAGAGRARVVAAFALVLWALVVLAWLADAAAVALFVPVIVVGWTLLRLRGISTHPTVRDARVAEGRDRSRDRDRDDPGTASDGGYTSGGHESGVAAASGSSPPIDGTAAPAIGFETVLLIAGATLALLVEFAYVAERAGPGRFNTVFKTYAQVWVLFGVAAGAVAARLAGSRPGSVLASGRARWAGRALVAVLVVSTSLYGALALADHFGNKGRYTPAEPTLDATTFVAETHPGEAAAIAWLGERTGQPNTVSVPGCAPHDAEGCPEDGSLRPYSWVNAPSSLTGVPTVAGWSHGYRGEAAYDERANDVRTVYEGSPEERAALLAAYDVRYIYVGPNERAAYDVRAFGALDGVSVAHRSGDVTIYGVDSDDLAASAG